jgi:hypothetical protein
VCREYAAQAITDQHQSQAVVARLRGLGLVAGVQGMTRGEVAGVPRVARPVV